VQVNAVQVDPVTGKATGETHTFALAGFLRRVGEADEALFALAQKADEAQHMQ
jgi:hypothetical protein